MPVSKAPLSATAECFTSSLLMNLTFPPRATVISEGEKAKSLISTVTVPCSTLPEAEGEGEGVAVGATETEAFGGFGLAEGFSLAVGE